MDKRLSQLYRILKWMILVFILSNILIKAAIWSSALKISQPGYEHNIVISKGFFRTSHRYTTEAKQKVFNTVNYLLTPVFIIPFIIIAVKLIKTPEIFKVEE